MGSLIPWAMDIQWLVELQVWCCTLSYPAALIMPNSQLFLMELNHFVSFFMLIRQDFHHLVLQRHIQLLPAAQISRYIYGMVTALVAVKWLDGYQLWVVSFLLRSQNNNFCMVGGRRHWRDGKEGLYTSQTSCVARSISYISSLYCSALQDRYTPYLCRQNPSMAFPSHFDPFCWLWGAVSWYIFRCDAIANDIFEGV